MGRGERRVERPWNASLVVKQVEVLRLQLISLLSNRSSFLLPRSQPKPAPKPRESPAPTRRARPLASLGRARLPL